MVHLAAHYERVRRAYPADPLMIVFDVDGTVLDTRYPLLRLLHAYDRIHATRWFEHVGLADIEEHGSRIDALLEGLGVAPVSRPSILDFCTRRLPRSARLADAQRPFPGVLEVIRWFQLQPRTQVGLDTGRPESCRADTLAALNRLGAEWKVRFGSEHLAMNSLPGADPARRATLHGLRRFRDAGYRVFAFVDNEPENLAAAAEMDPEGELLLLHADTLFESRRDLLPPAVLSGRDYDLPALIPQRALPSRVDLVWHGVNDRANLEEFLASPVRWAETDVRRDPASDRPVLSHDPIDTEEAPARRDLLPLDVVLGAVAAHGRAIKLDFKEGEVVESALRLVDRLGLAGEDLWFNADVEVLGEKGFRSLRERYPDAVLQCPLGFLAPLLAVLPDRAFEIARELVSWGIDRFSLAWHCPDLPRHVDRLRAWGHEVNIYAVPDLESFLRATLLLPRSVTADFNFPRWGYAGRGPGAGRATGAEARTSDRVA
jgi:phosphoglycolate phosphatase-like HAD superfamily hydrolase